MKFRDEAFKTLCDKEVKRLNKYPKKVLILSFIIHEMFFMSDAEVSEKWRKFHKEVFDGDQT